MMSDDEFNNVQVDEDTQIIFQNQLTLSDYAVMHQKWCWDGITAESIIFESEDVTDLNDDQIQSLIIDSKLPQIGSSYTVNRTDEGFTFVNFNFVS